MFRLKTLTEIGSTFDSGHQGLILTRITADDIRREGITSVEVIDLGFVESNGDMTRVAPPPRVSKPFPVQVVAA